MRISKISITKIQFANNWFAIQCERFIISRLMPACFVLIRFDLTQDQAAKIHSAAESDDVQDSCKSNRHVVREIEPHTR